VRISCRVRAFTVSGQGRKSSEDLSVTVSGVKDRGSFDQCVSYTKCVIKTLGSVEELNYHDEFSQFLSRNALESSAALMTKLRTAGQVRHRSIAAGRRDFLFCPEGSDLFCCPPNFLFIWYTGKGGFPQGWSGRDVVRTTQLHPVLRLWMGGVLPPPHRPSWRAKAHYFFLETVLNLMTLRLLHLVYILFIKVTFM
jgi:hypothetical protein